MVLETLEGLTAVMRVLEKEGTFCCSGVHLPVEENYLPLCRVEVTALTSLTSQTKFGMSATSGPEVLPVFQKRITQNPGPEVAEWLQSILLPTQMLFRSSFVLPSV